MIVITPLGRFRSRQSEWEKSAIVAGMGAVFLMPGDAMGTPGLAWMKTVMPENIWGGVFLMAGLVALLALWINGRRDRVTTWTRAVSAIARFALFSALSIASALKGDWGIGQVLWPIFMLVEAVNIFFTMNDVGSAIAHNQQTGARPHAANAS